MSRPLLLDLFCGAGGAARGYHDAGFDVHGVDIKDMPRFPYEFHQGDALKVLDDLLNDGCLLSYKNSDWSADELHLSDFAAIHASPPCQHWSSLSNCVPGTKDKYPALIEPVRERLRAIGLPYVIENVPGAPLLDPVTLCGTSFGLAFNGLEIRRHRLFETSGLPLPPLSCAHSGYVMNPHNVAGRQRMRDHGIAQGSLHRTWRREMGSDWMTDPEARESIPHVFTEYIGTHLREALQAESQYESELAA